MYIPSTEHGARTALGFVAHNRPSQRPSASGFSRGHQESGRFQAAGAILPRPRAPSLRFTASTRHRTANRPTYRSPISLQALPPSRTPNHPGGLHRVLLHHHMRLPWIWPLWPRPSAETSRGASLPPALTRQPTRCPSCCAYTLGTLGLSVQRPASLPHLCGNPHWVPQHPPPWASTAPTLPLAPSRRLPRPSSRNHPSAPLAVLPMASNGRRRPNSRLLCFISAATCIKSHHTLGRRRVLLVVLPRRVRELLCQLRMSRTWHCCLLLLAPLLLHPVS